MICLYLYQKIKSCLSPQRKELCLKAAKITGVALVSVGIAGESVVLGTVVGGGALAYYLLSHRPAPVKAPKFQRVEAQDPWNEVYLPLFRELQKQGVRLGTGNDWTAEAVKFLTTHDLWFHEGKFHVAKKSDKINDRAATFYALISLAYSCQNNYEQMNAIYSLLIRPFRNLVSQETLREVYWPFQVALFRSANRGRHDAFDDVGEKSNEDKAALQIQRTWRRWKSKSLYYPRKEYALPLRANPPIPRQSNTIVPATANTWIASHSPDLQPIARKFLGVVRHVSFKKFLLQLYKAVQSFNNKLLSLPPAEREFVIIIPAYGHQKSNQWVTEIALPFFKKPPEGVIKLDQAQEFCRLHPTVRHAVILDDALYSGKQMRDFISAIKIDCFFHVIIPYMTKHGIDRITSSKVWISEHERMLTLEDFCAMRVFNQEDQELLRNWRDEYWPFRSLTYFDHKIADQQSTFWGIFEFGYLINGDWPLKGALVPKTQVPYKT
jgi:hypothetical protein